MTEIANYSENTTAAEKGPASDPISLESNAAATSSESRLQAALGEIVAADRGITHHRCAASDLQLDAGREVDVKELGRLRFSKGAYEALRRRLRIPAELERRLDAQSRRSLRQYLWNNEIVNAKDDSLPIGWNLSLAVRDGTIIGFVHPRLISLRNADVVTVLREAAGNQLKNAAVRDIEVSANGAFKLRFTTPIHRGEPRPGDIVEAGVSVSHFPLGEAATQVKAFLHRLVCSNGWVVPVEIITAKGKRKRSRVRRLELENFCREDVLRRLGVILKKTWHDIEETLAALQSTTTLELNHEPAAILRSLAQDHRLSKRTTEAVVAALQNDELGPPEGNGTVYDLVLAISRVGTHGPENPQVELAPRTMEQLISIAGNLLITDRPNACPYCKRLLNSATSTQPSAN